MSARLTPNNIIAIALTEMGQTCFFIPISPGEQYHLILHRTKYRLFLLIRQLVVWVCDKMSFDCSWIQRLADFFPFQARILDWLYFEIEGGCGNDEILFAKRITRAYRLDYRSASTCLATVFLLGEAYTTDSDLSIVAILSDLSLMEIVPCVSYRFSRQDVGLA